MVSELKLYQKLPRVPSVSNSLSVLLIHYKDLQLTLDCIESLLRSDYCDFNIVVVDNSSIPENIAAIRKLCSNHNTDFYPLDSMPSELDYNKTVYWYTSPSNTGYSGGMNLGAEIAKAGNPDYLLILNNDTIVPSLFLSSFLEKIQSTSQQDFFGFASSLILTLPEKQIWYAGGEIDLIRGAGVHHTEKPSDFQIQETGFVSGCCMLCKTPVYEALSGMDERFFLYMEDVDLCLRARQKGYRLYFVPDIELHHRVGSSTGGEHADLPIFYSTRNRIKLMRKHYSGLVLARFYAFFLTSRMIKVIVCLFTGKLKSIPPLIRGIRDGFEL
jgi:GT2 family glycosyltransferase